MDTTTLSRTIDQIAAAAEDAADAVADTASDVRDVVSSRGRELTDTISARSQELAAQAQETVGDDDDSSRWLTVLLVLGVAALVAYLLKRKREQELDEALWEEPRAL